MEYQNRKVQELNSQKNSSLKVRDGGASLTDNRPATTVQKQRLGLLNEKHLGFITAQKQDSPNSAMLTPSSAITTHTIQRVAQTVSITGLTHAVQAKNGSIYEGIELGQLNNNETVEIDTDQKVRSRRGPNQEFFREEDQAKPAMYRWFKLLRIGSEAAPNDAYIRDDTFHTADRAVLGHRPTVISADQRARHEVLINPNVEIGKDGRFSIAVNQTTKQVLVKVNLALPRDLDFAREKAMVESFWSNKFSLQNRVTHDSYTVHIVMNIHSDERQSHYNVQPAESGGHNVNRENNSFTHDLSSPELETSATHDLQHLIENAFNSENMSDIKAYFIKKGIGFPIQRPIKVQFVKSVQLDKKGTFMRSLTENGLFSNVSEVAGPPALGKRIGIEGFSEVMSKQRAIIHEFGHMIGLGEEYAAPPANTQNTDPIDTVFGKAYGAAAAGGNVDRTTIMGLGEDLMPHHYIGILQAFSGLTDVPLADLTIVS